MCRKERIAPTTPTDTQGHFTNYFVVVQHQRRTRYKPGKKRKKGKYKRETGVRMVKLMDALLPYIFYEKSETHAYFFEATTESERTLYIPSLQCFRSRLSGHSYVCIEEKVYSYPWVEPLYVVFFSIRRTYVL